MKSHFAMSKGDRLLCPELQARELSLPVAGSVLGSVFGVRQLAAAFDRRTACSAFRHQTELWFRSRIGSGSKLPLAGANKIVLTDESGSKLPHSIARRTARSEFLERHLAVKCLCADDVILRADVPACGIGMTTFKRVVKRRIRNGPTASRDRDGYQRHIVSAGRGPLRSHQFGGAWKPTVGRPRLVANFGSL